MQKLHRPRKITEPCARPSVLPRFLTGAVPIISHFRAERWSALMAAHPYAAHHPPPTPVSPKNRKIAKMLINPDFLNSGLPSQPPVCVAQHRLLRIFSYRFRCVRRALMAAPAELPQNPAERHVNPRSGKISELQEASRFF